MMNGYLDQIVTLEQSAAKDDKEKDDDPNPPPATATKQSFVTVIGHPIHLPVRDNLFYGDRTKPEPRYSLKMLC